MRSPDEKNMLKETFAKAHLPAEIEVRGRGAWLVPSRFAGLQRAAGRRFDKFRFSWAWKV
jgi:hypothetical protein